MADDDLFDDDFEFDDEDDAELEEEDDYEYDEDEDEDDDGDDEEEDDDADEEDLARGDSAAKKKAPLGGKPNDSASKSKGTPPAPESKGSGKSPSRGASRTTDRSGATPRSSASRLEGHDKPSAINSPESHASSKGGDPSSRREERASGAEHPAEPALPTDPIPLESFAAPPPGPPADHLVHIYEFGQLKRTLPRKFTDEEAVSFSEEYTRTSKVYGRLAVAMPDDEVPAPSFADAAKG